jgi:GST-like protein
MIDVYTAHTPNGIKIPIALEELDVPYRLHRLSLGGDQMRSKEFLRINPNGKIPAIVDDTEAGQPPFSVFESGAILLHLADKYGGLIGRAPASRAQTLSWLFLQVAGLGPNMGNAGHFRGLGRQDDDYALQRFRDESLRHLQVLDKRLEESEWLNGEAYSVADIAHFSWARRPAYAGLSLDGLPALSRWLRRIEERPATVRALQKLA